MKKYMILFAVGKDRPGIVDDVSTLLFERGANIEDSRMTVLGGCFSIMTLFSCSPQQLETIQTDIVNLHQTGLETSLHAAQEPTAGRLTPVLPLKIEATAIDHPGIIQKVVRMLHEHNVNIQSLKTEVVRAPLSGAPLLELSLEADVPAEASIVLIKEKLDDLAVELNLNLNFVERLPK